MDFCDHDDNGYRELSIKRVKAKKEHTCADCKQPIMPGESYLRRNFMYEGTFYSEATHTHNGLCGDFLEYAEPKK